MVELIRSDVEGSISNPVRVLCKGVEAPPCSKDGSSLRVVWHVGGSSNSAEVEASGWLTDPEDLALARCATRARDSSLGRATLRSGVEEERVSVRMFCVEESC